MLTVPRMTRVLHQVFKEEARTLARSMGVIQRERKLNRVSMETLAAAQHDMRSLIHVLLLLWTACHQPGGAPRCELSPFHGRRT